MALIRIKILDTQYERMELSRMSKLTQILFKSGYN